jgi:hypothetical protein
MIPGFCLSVKWPAALSFEIVAFVTGETIPLTDFQE